MYIKETISKIEIFANDSNDSIYTIPKANLDDILNKVDGEIISDWINQLLGKTWIEHSILYEVAQIIVREFPKNKIDWQSTFFMVEKHFHDKEVKRKLAIENPGIEEDAITSLFNSIQIGRQESNETTRNEILKNVDDLLKKYGILKK
jgi:hypothetical protein